MTDPNWPFPHRVGRGTEDGCKHRSVPVPAYGNVTGLTPAQARSLYPRGWGECRICGWAGATYANSEHQGLYQ